MTRVLPSIAVLLSAPVERRHRPQSEAQHERGYERFRSCLRWDFAFTCSFCLLHEAQVCPSGAVGSSQFSIEHLELQSERPELRNAYGNLVYACRRCNLARGSRRRVDARGRRLLDPCSQGWAAHFVHDGDELRPLTADAAYTSETYDMNCPVKVVLRRDRREAIDEAVHVLNTVPALLVELMAGVDFHSGHEQRMRLAIAEQLHKALAAARRTLVQLAAIPHDAAAPCVCDAAACDLPMPVAATLLHVELEAGTQ